MRVSAAPLQLLAMLIVLAGCPICPDDDLPVVEGALPVAPGESVQFIMVYGDDTYDHARACGLHWYVNEIEGGNDELGTVSSCGRYTAPALIPDTPVWVGGHRYELYGCADCCLGSQRQITFATTESIASARRAPR